ncbi:MAG: Flagellar biosynthetic protein FlhB [Chlamydiales bacterium]|nr:Flagellar biosynthetic protein FlhB [Chlamydiales bacterium]
MEKTEKPSKQKLKKARQRGDVAKSSFLAGALVFVGGVLFIGGLHALLAERFQKSMRAAFVLIGGAGLEGAFKMVLDPLIYPVAGIMVGIVAIAIGAHLFQTGWIWAPERIRPKWRKKGSERRIVFPLLQLFIISAIGYLTVRTCIDPDLLFASVAKQSSALFRKLFGLCLQIGAALLFLGLCDLFYQKWRYDKKMRMTREELKQERRENEGDTQLKGEMRNRRD